MGGAYVLPLDSLHPGAGEIPEKAGGEWGLFLLSTPKPHCLCRNTRQGGNRSGWKNSGGARQTHPLLNAPLGQDEVQESARHTFESRINRRVVQKESLEKCCCSRTRVDHKPLRIPRRVCQQDLGKLNQPPHHLVEPLCQDQTGGGD